MTDTLGILPELVWAALALAYLMQELQLLQLPLVLEDEAVPTGPPAGQVLLSPHVRH